MASSTTRRGIIAGLASITGMGAVPLAAAVSSANDQVDKLSTRPDAALLEAEEAWWRTVDTFDAADAAWTAADKAYRAAMGDCPAVLHFDFGHNNYIVRRVREVSGEPIGPEWDHLTLADGEEARITRLSGKNLRHIIKWLPKACGPAGRTPHEIRWLRSLLPLADARDAEEAHWSAIHRIDECSSASSAARTAREAAGERILNLPATTMVGVGVKARYARYWLRVDGPWRGYTVRQPDCLLALMAAAADVSDTDPQTGRLR